ncbi:MAG TPA: hypothetical protein DCX25_00395 [Candidatus Pacebacteria bacterium]|nr:MAG: hypothetical protein UX00_C0003G0064 [Microgenomates group bacterium GW2011_GWB1_45_17]KKU24131.1 MAG: hypothetical protein UX36_C0002G0114 [Microgenomates group bacterium GW2011_GWC1_46_15]KKU24846.1 MAG: hypothetical protein UX35_C0001G0028 [Microgenomates group bacterium GW2011_GWA1_46_15]HAV14780.1 hypothetical protein [Candidatus Paceibacterota bacterium]HCR11171.1 hypothetical protein [Candidatus Paceibacterota bacterium]
MLTIDNPRQTSIAEQATRKEQLLDTIERKMERIGKTPRHLLHPKFALYYGGILNKYLNPVREFITNSIPQDLQPLFRNSIPRENDVYRYVLEQWLRPIITSSAERQSILTRLNVLEEGLGNDILAYLDLFNFDDKEDALKRLCASMANYACS